MVAAPTTAHGTKVYLGLPTSLEEQQDRYALVEADVIGQSWVEIARVERAGMLGDVGAALVFQSVDGPARRSGGALDAGVFEFAGPVVKSDNGQALFRAAVKDQTDYFMRVAYSDDVNEYFIARPLSARRSAPRANDPLMLTCRVAVVSNILEVE